MNSYFNDYLLLDEKWNCFADHPLNIPDLKIIHFAGPNKLHRMPSHLLYKYISLTPFRFEEQTQKANKKVVLVSIAKKLVKTCARKILSVSLRNGLCRKAAVKFANHIRAQYLCPPPPAPDMRNTVIPALVAHHFPDNLVSGGPFRDCGFKMAIPDIRNRFPKLLGSYRQEIHPVIEHVIAHNAPEIVILGARDGYFAVGLALALKNAHFLLYEEDASQREKCVALAEENKTAGRMVFINNLTQLHSLNPLQKSSFVLSDLHGMEKKHFTNDVFTIFSKSYILIYVRERYDLYIADYIRNSSNETHKIKIINTLDVYEKTIDFEYTKISKYSLPMRKYLLDESIEEPGRWFYFIPKIF